MLIEIFPSGPFSTNAYVATCSATEEAVIIDPAPQSAQTIHAFIQGKKLKCKAILLTHSHWDHIADVAALKEFYPVPVYIHPLDIPNLRQPGADQLPCWIPFPAVEPDVLIEESAVITLGELRFRVIHTPGHTPGGVCFYEPAKNILFSGDTLFKGSIGNLSFPTCQPDKMWGSLEKLAGLPPETRVYPGHGPATTILAESWLSQAKQIFG
ncbi:MAG: MBL fold metallo-hydrolase [Candidatus Protochlamydia sp.]|nr:MBL fold metallo-hydrolase [Candidatus Protochlamydia sp.]